MHHRVPHFDPGPETIEKDATGQTFQLRHQAPGGRFVLFVDVQRDGELAFHPVDNAGQLVDVAAPHDKR